MSTWRATRGTNTLAVDVGDRRAVEGDDQLGEAAILRGTVAAVQTAHGEAPGLPVPTAAEAHVHRGREEAAHLGVQATDASEKARYEKFMVNAS